MRTLYTLLLPLSLLSLSVSVLAQGNVKVIDEASVRQALNLIQIPAPAFGNTVSDPSHMEKKCYEAALRKAYGVVRSNRLVGNEWDPKIESDLDEAIRAMGEEHRSAILSAAVSSPNAATFINNLPVEPETKNIEKKLESGFENLRSGFYLNRVSETEPCVLRYEVKSEDRNSLDPSITGGSITGEIEFQCACSAENRIMHYRIGFTMPASLSFDPDLSSEITVIPDMSRFSWHVNRLGCCRNPDEEEDPSGTDVRPSGGISAGLGYNLVEDMPWTGPSVTGFLGYTTSRQTGSNQSDFMLGARARYPVCNSAAVAVDGMWTNTRDKNGSSITRGCFGEIGAFFEYYFGCGGGPVRPYVAVGPGLTFGTEAFDFEGSTSDPIKDGVLGWNLRADYGFVTKVSDNLAVGLHVPGIEYGRQGRRTKGSDVDRISDSWFVHSINKKAPSINITYDFGDGSYQNDGQGFNPTENGLIGCGNIAYWHWIQDGYRESDTWLGAGLMTPVADDALVGGALNVGVNRGSFLSYSPLGGDERDVFNNSMVRGDVMGQYYLCDDDRPVRPMVGAAVHIGGDFDRFKVGGQMDAQTSRGWNYGATLSAGAYWSVTDRWGLLANAPLFGVNHDVGSEGSGLNTWTAGVNKWVFGAQVLYDIGARDDF